MPKKKGETNEEYDTSPKKSKKSKKKVKPVEIEEIIETSEIVEDSFESSANTSIATTVKSPQKPTKKKKSLQPQPDHYGVKKKISAQNSEKAAACIINLNLSREKYNGMASIVKKQGANVFPPYKKASMAKKKFAPSGITATPKEANVSWQNLVDHTIRRIIQIPENSKSIDDYVQSSGNHKYIMYGSWGFDGSGSQISYHQEFEKNVNDSSIFVTSFIPLRIVSSDTNELVWSNECPHSHRTCRVKKLEFAKENREYVVREKKKNDEEIQSIEDIVVTLPSGKIIFVSPQLFCTLVDGKVRAFLTETSSFAVCTLCKCPPSKMNELENFGANNQFKVAPQALQYGLSNLHLYIRVIEALLHLSYKSVLPDDQYRVGKKNSEIVNKRKVEVKLKFREVFGYDIDKPGTNGGTSTTGKIARTALSRPDDLGLVLGIDPELIRRLQTLLLTISSCLPIDSDKFSAYALETAKLYVRLYGKFPMTTTLHTLLIHGSTIIENCILPIGLLSEEAAEANNKFIRNDRSEHARKNSRENNMFDVFARSLHRSDPMVSHMALKDKIKKKVHRKLPEDVESLLIQHVEIENETQCVEGEEQLDFDEQYLKALDEMEVEYQPDLEMEMEVEYDCDIREKL